MEKIIFSHSDEPGKQHSELRKKLLRDTEAFERSGKSIKQIPFGASADPMARKVTGIESCDQSRQVAARVNRQHGGRLTKKQMEIVIALQELEKIPGIVLTKHGLKNKMRLQLNTINSRLQLLADKGYLRVDGDKITLKMGVGNVSGI